MKSGFVSKIRRPGWSTVSLLATLLLFPVSTPAQQAQPSASSPQPQHSSHEVQGSAAQGEDLFTGRVAFHNGGPACITCHSVSGIPHGGTTGPDLTQVYTKYGAAGTAAAIRTLPFPMMVPIYHDHLLDTQEQADMVAFFRQASDMVAAPSSHALQGSFARGEDLFTGRTRFRNGGPACIACHSVEGLPFPNGGTLGPDLTQTFTKLGPTGTAAAMQTLYFPAMIPIYRDRQLAPQEQADLEAFFSRTATLTVAPSSQITWALILAALVLGIIFVAITAIVWRNRVLSVRRALVARARKQGVRA